ncbi:hypothetical protein AYO20_05879 [Fonsecaea nubica]|uniref:Uncharacterized protein n=1 Tax=Fonsecaea nubica TaxID=856822 RepID=A0A178CYM8_9EURO|nr:hypothetical protein AYO20_05879 [Fonsecaea nubica]OAL34918.1 hypothetical protein AYO20_05879 [Fonsecaea nubica]
MDDVLELPGEDAGVVIDLDELDAVVVEDGPALVVTPPAAEEAGEVVGADETVVLPPVDVVPAEALLRVAVPVALVLGLEIDETTVVGTAAEDVVTKVTRIDDVVPGGPEVINVVDEGAVVGSTVVPAGVLLEVSKVEDGPGRESLQQSWH